MELNINILYALEKMRIPFFDYLFYGITYLGSEATAVFVVLVIYWCVNKREGLFILANCLFASGLNQIVKLLCHVPRPFMTYPDLHITEVTRSTAGGFSFPSGHTQTSVSLYGSIAQICRKKSVRIFCILMIVLIAFSRMYLGAHYPTDILGGAVSGLIVLVILSSLRGIVRRRPYLVSVLFGIGAAVMMCALFLFETGPWKAMFLELTDPEKLADMMKALGICAGCALAVAVCEPVERRYVRFETEAIWWAQILKTAIGLLLMGALALIMKTPAEQLMGESGFAYVLRFFVPVVFGLCIWPMAFRWFPKPKHVV